jgi:5-dehydro-2-deoxygluconokinase
VILPKRHGERRNTVARGIRRLYALGIRPDWWKLEPV